MDGVKIARVSAPTRRTYHHGNLRPLLLAQAARILDREGVDAVTIRAVARAAKVAHSAPANHFPDRKSLLTALASGFFRDVEAAVEGDLAARGGTPRGRVKAFADALLAFGLAHPHRYRLLWRRDILDVGDPELNAAMDALYARLVGELSSADWAHAASADTVAIGLWSMVHGYVSMRLDGMLVAKRDAVTGATRQDAIVDLLLDGAARAPAKQVERARPRSRPLRARVRTRSGTRTSR